MFRLLLINSKQRLGSLYSVHLITSCQYCFSRATNHNSTKNLVAGLNTNNSENTDCKSKMGSNINDQIFIGQIDNYRGVHIESTKEPCENGIDFATKLQASLQKWIEDNIRGVWFRIALEHADWVPILAKNGFSFHHVEGELVTMCRWLPVNEESRIPLFAHTMVGAGAIVKDTDGKILVVQETYRNIPFWKLPGGYVEPGEDIVVAAIREVYEETNITTEFKSVVAIRHSHGVAFGCSDLYFIVELIPTSHDIKKCDREIEACEWMEIDTFLNHPSVHKNNRAFLHKYLSNKATGVSIIGEKIFHPITNKPQTLFCIEGNNLSKKS